MKFLRTDFDLIFALKNWLMHDWGKVLYWNSKIKRIQKKTYQYKTTLCYLKKMFIIKSELNKGFKFFLCIIIYVLQPIQMFFSVFCLILTSLDLFVKIF